MQASLSSPAAAPQISAAALARSRIVARLVLLVGLAVAGLGGWSAYLGWRTLSWPQVEARIEDKDVHWSRSWRDDRDCRGSFKANRCRERTPSVRISYSYEAAGRIRTGRATSAGVLGVQTVAEAREIHESFDRGSRLTVAVSPTNPDEAYLRPGVAGPAKLALGIGLAIAALAWIALRILRGADPETV